MNPSTPVVATVSTNFEDLVVSATLLAVGGLGILLGVLSPQCTTEMALGMLTVLVLARAKLREIAHARRESTENR